MGSRAALEVLVADDHPAVLGAVRATLEKEGFGSVTTAADGREAIAAARERRPDVAVVDLRMPGCSGVDLVRRLRDALPPLRVVVYTAEADGQTATELLEAGADGLVLKDAPLSELARALDGVAAGRRYVDPAVGGAPPHQQLTEREREVLALIAEGLPHAEIGRRLGIGAETARSHARKAAERLGARTRTQAVATAIRLRLI